MCYGDKIQLCDEQTQRWLCADGFSTTTLMCNPPRQVDTSSIFEITCKQSYQELKRYKKRLSSIGIKTREELDTFKQQEDVDPRDVLALQKLDGIDAPAGQGPSKLEIEDRNNLEEVERWRGKQLSYGKGIQLKHVNSGKYIILSKEAGLQPGSSRLEVDKDGGEGAWIAILPGFKVRKEGDPVAVDDQAKFKMTKKSTQDRPLWVHANNNPAEKGMGSLDENCVEVNATDQDTKFVVSRYQRWNEGAGVLCSGNTFRLRHKEEQGYLTHGQVWSDQDVQKRRIHILSQTVQSCSNSLWEVEQMDVTSVEALTERAKAGLRSEPHEFSGNGTWEKLYRLKHKGSGEYLAASFDSSASTDSANPHGPVRIYFTALRKEKAFREAHLETLWALRPVNPKDDQAEPITLTEPFHIQHAATCYWILAKSAEGSDQGKYYDDDMSRSAETEGPTPQTKRTQRMIEMVAERPYADAFGLSAADPAEVLDIYLALKLKPRLERYAKMLEDEFAEEEQGEDLSMHHPKVPQAKAQTAIDLLTQLIREFLVPDSNDTDPLTRTGPTEITEQVRRRQQLLREQGFLDIIVRMTSAQSDGVKYERLEQLEPNVYKVCRLANALTEHIVKANTENCLYMRKYIQVYRSQIGHKLAATDVLTALHKDNLPLLTSLARDEFEDWVDVINTSINEEKVEDRLELAVSFLSITCVCAPDKSAASVEETTIKDNQTAILEHLFDDGAIQDNCVLQFQGSGPDIRAKVPIKSKNFPFMFLEDIFKEDKDRQKRAIQDYFVSSIELYANLCKGRNQKAIVKLRKLFPKQLVLEMIMEPRGRQCDRLRAQFCNLFVRLYVDCDTYPADEDPIQLTRVWTEIGGNEVNRISDLDEEDFKDLKNWIYLFLSDELPEDDEQMHNCCTQMTSSEFYDGRNSLILAVVKVVFKMVQLRCYFHMVPPKGRSDKEPKSALKDVLKPLLQILNGQTDRNLEANQEPGEQATGNAGPWRFTDTPQNKKLTETKTWICRILDRVSSLRLNVRMSNLLEQYKEEYLAKKDGEKYIRAGSKFKLKSSSKGQLLDSDTKKIFEILDFEDKDLGLMNGTNLDLILLDLVVYEDAQLVSESMSLLLRQHKQRIECGENLCNVQLLCSRLQVAFLDRGKNLKKALTRFKDLPVKGPQQCRDVSITLDNMILTITLQEKDNDTVVDADVCKNRQELYKNIGVPQILLDILGSLTIDAKDIRKLCSKVYKFLTLVCTGLEETKQELKRAGFELFLEHLTAEVGADKLVTELFIDNRALCIQITPDDIKQFVNLIVTQGRSPRWLGFMNSLVLPVRGQRPITKNQTQVIKALVANKTKTMQENGSVKPSLFVTQESWNDFRDRTMAKYKEAPSANTQHTEALRYHVELVSLFCKCAQGKNRAAEELCQEQFPQADVIRGLKDDQTIPYVKRAYLEFLWETYIEVERPDKKTQFDEEMWKAMNQMRKDLHDCIDLQYDLNAYQSTPETDLNKKEQVQYVYDKVVWFLDSWFGGGDQISYYEPEKWGVFGVTTSRIAFSGCELTIGEMCTELLDGVCCLNDPTMPPLQMCEITTSLKDSVNVCVCRMMERGVQPSKKSSPGGTDFTKLAEKLKDKGREFLDNVDMYPAGRPPLTNEALTQKGLTMFARDFVQIIHREDEEYATNSKATNEKGPLVKMLRELLQFGNPALVPYGTQDDKNAGNEYKPWKYIQKMVAEIMSAGCRDEDKPELLGLLQDLIEMQPFPETPGQENQPETEGERQDQIRKLLSGPDIDLPRLVINLIAELGLGGEGEGKGIFKAALQLCVALVGSGFKPVQDRMLELFQENTGDGSSKTEPFFGELESRLTTAKTECKEAKRHYEQEQAQALEWLEQEQKDKAMFANAGQQNAKEILDLTAPPREKFTDTERGHVCKIMELIRQLCEDNNQQFKEFMQFQPASSRSHDLVQKTVEYLEVWEKNKCELTIDYGVCVFDALTELVIGPCQVNQDKIESELKIETVNNILKAAAIPMNQFAGASASFEQGAPAKIAGAYYYDVTGEIIDEGNGEYKVAEEAVESQVQAGKAVLDLKMSCVLLLHSMLEGQTTGGRVLKKLEELDPRNPGGSAGGKLFEEVVKIDQKRLNSIGFLNKYVKKRTFGDDLHTLAFQMMVLLRRIHDANDIPSRPSPFKKRWLDEYEEGTEMDNASAALDFFFGTPAKPRMGRIEISREEPNKEPRLERVYFEVPSRCHKLTPTTLKKLIDEIDRGSREDKLKEFVSERTNELGFEMKVQEYWSRLVWYRALDSFRSELKTFSFYLAFIINLLILTGIDHEDKYDADPRANVASTLGEPTSYNLLDFVSVDATGWKTLEVCEGFSMPCNDKVAYIPDKMYTLITACGFAQTSMSSVNFLLFVLATGPMKVRERWRLRHNDREDAEKLKNSNHEREPFSTKYFTELPQRIQGAQPRFLLQSIYYLFFDAGVVYQIMYIACTILGNFVSPFFFAVHTLDILNRDDKLKAVLDAIIEPLGTIVQTLILSMIVMYVFTLIGFVIFHDHFNPGDAKQDNLCNSLLQCYIFTIYSGIISAEVWAETGVADLWPKHPYGVQHAPEMNDLRMFLMRLIYDLAFFLFIGVVLIGGVLFGIILDTFSEIRTRKATNTEHQRGMCFICEIDRDKFVAPGFNPHVKGDESDHNMWYYLYFIIYLRDVNVEDYNGPESYVAKMLPIDMQPGDEPDVKWMPNGAALVLAGEGEGDSDKELTLSLEVGKLQEDLVQIKKENELTTATVVELLSALKRMEQTAQA